MIKAPVAFVPKGFQVQLRNTQGSLLLVIYGGGWGGSAGGFGLSAKLCLQGREAGFSGFTLPPTNDLPSLAKDQVLLLETAAGLSGGPVPYLFRSTADFVFLLLILYYAIGVLYARLDICYAPRFSKIVGARLRWWGGPQGYPMGKKLCR